MALTINSFDGFDLYPTSLADFPSGPNVRFVGNPTSNLVSGLQFLETAARTPGKGFDVAATNTESNDNLGNGDAAILYSLDNPQIRNSDIIIGASVQLRSSNTSHALFATVQSDGEMQFGLRANGSGFLEVTSATQNPTSVAIATSSVALPIGIWNFIEWSLTTRLEAGRSDDVNIERTVIRVNGVVVLDFSEQNPSGASTAQQLFESGSPVTDIAIGVVPVSSIRGEYGGDYMMDNLYYGERDGLGDVLQDFLGERQVTTFAADTLEADTVGFVAFGGSTVADRLSSFDGTLSGYRASDIGDTLVVSNSAGFPLPPSTIDAVIISQASSKVGAGSQVISPILRIDGQNFSNNSVGLGEGFLSERSAPFLSNPATGQPWSAAAVDGLSFGIELL